MSLIPLIMCKIGNTWPTRFRLPQSGEAGKSNPASTINVYRLVRSTPQAREGDDRSRRRNNSSSRGVVAEPDEILFLLIVTRFQLGQARRGAAEDVVLSLLREKWQVIDSRRQVEVPVRIVGGVEEPVFRIHHAERLFHCLEILNLHGL